MLSAVAAGGDAGQRVWLPPEWVSWCMVAAALADRLLDLRKEDGVDNGLVLAVCHDGTVLELGDGAEEAADHPAGCRPGVDALLDGDDADAGAFAAVADVEQVAEVAAEPVELPEDEPLEGACPRIIQEPVQLILAF